jgi:hypothetical protein
MLIRVFINKFEKKASQFELFINVHCVFSVRSLTFYNLWQLLHRQ